MCLNCAWACHSNNLVWQTSNDYRLHCEAFSWCNYRGDSNVSVQNVNVEIHLNNLKLRRINITASLTRRPFRSRKEDRHWEKFDRHPCSLLARAQRQSKKLFKFDRSCQVLCVVCWGGFGAFLEAIVWFLRFYQILSLMLVF